MAEVSKERGRFGKKLKRVARAIAYGRRGQSDPEKPSGLDEETLEQFRDLGMTDEQLKAQPLEEEETIEVWEENWKAAMAFLALQTQWNISLGFGCREYTGLNYQSAASLFLEGPSKKARKGFEALMAKLMVMELEALPILNEANQ